MRSLELTLLRVFYVGDSEGCSHWRGERSSHAPDPTNHELSSQLRRASTERKDVVSLLTQTDTSAGEMLMPVTSFLVMREILQLTQRISCRMESSGMLRRGLQRISCCRFGTENSEVVRLKLFARFDVFTAVTMKNGVF
jgi:hypothetical protein